MKLMLHVVNSKIKDALVNVVINLKVFINILKVGNLKCQCISNTASSYNKQLMVIVVER